MNGRPLAEIAADLRSVQARPFGYAKFDFRELCAEAARCLEAFDAVRVKFPSAWPVLEGMMAHATNKNTPEEDAWAAEFLGTLADGWE